MKPILRGFIFLWVTMLSIGSDLFAEQSKTQLRVHTICTRALNTLSQIEPANLAGRSRTENETLDLFREVEVGRFDGFVADRLRVAQQDAVQIIRNHLLEPLFEESDSVSGALDQEVLFLSDQGNDPDETTVLHLNYLADAIESGSSEIEALQLNGSTAISDYFGSVATSGKGAIPRIVGGVTLASLGVGAAYLTSSDAEFTRALEFWESWRSDKQSLYEKGYQELGNYLALLGVGLGSVNLTRGALRFWNRDVPMDHQFRLLAEQNDSGTLVAIHSIPAQLEGGQHLIITHIISWEKDETDPTKLVPKLTIIKSPHPNSSEKYEDWSLQVEISKLSNNTQVVKYMGRTYVFKRDNKQADYDFHVHDIADSSRPFSGWTANLRLFATKPKFERRSISETDREMLLEAIEGNHTSMFDPNEFGKPVEERPRFRDRAVGRGHRWTRNLAIGALALGMGIWPAPYRFNHPNYEDPISPVAYATHWPADQIWKHYENDLLFQMAIGEHVYNKLKSEHSREYDFYAGNYRVRNAVRRFEREKSARDLPTILFRRAQLERELSSPEAVFKMANAEDDPIEGFGHVWHEISSANILNSHRRYYRVNGVPQVDPSVPFSIVPTLDHGLFNEWLTAELSNDTWMALPDKKWGRTVDYLLNVFVNSKYRVSNKNAKEHVEEFLATLPWPEELKDRFRQYISKRDS